MPRPQPKSVCLQAIKCIIAQSYLEEVKEIYRRHLTKVFVIIFKIEVKKKLFLKKNVFLKEIK